MKETRDVIACTLDADPRVDVGVDHIATLPDGTTLRIPAGTVLRPAIGRGCVRFSDEGSAIDRAKETSRDG